MWVDGAVLYARTLRGYADPIRLDRRNRGRQLFLRDADDASLQLDATNVRLERWWEVLAPFIGPFDRAANEALRRRVSKYR